MMDLSAAYGSPSGGGITRNPSHEKEVYWLREAANQGHTPAMYILSKVSTVLVTNKERVMWLKKGAELGNKACMVELMNGYQVESYGLPKDTGAFLYWEARVSAATRKENGMTPEEIAMERRKGEARRRRDLNYDGPIRPLP